MDSGMNQAAIAMGRGMRAQEIFADNLAHVSVPGYRRRVLVERTFDRELGRAIGGADRGTSSAIDFHPGFLEETGNRLDVGLDGPGFLAVSGEAGETLYTRAGTLSTGSDGSLRSRDGFPVLGQGGRPLFLDPDGGAPTIRPDGEVVQGDNPVGRLRIVEFDAPYPLRAAGTTYWRATPGAIPRDADATTVRQGFREGSNVDPTKELVDMMAVFRNFESAQKALSTIDQSIQRLLQASSGN